MNAKMRQRLIVVTGVIVIVAIVVFAIVAGTTSSKQITVEEAASGEFNGKKVQVQGKVVDNSFTYEAESLTFRIYNSGGDANKTLKVFYAKGVTSNFGNQVDATCTGVIDADGVLQCTELLTQCPSKYEGSTDTIGIEQLLNYGESVVDSTVKITGKIKEGSLQSAGKGDRFVVIDLQGSAEMPVIFDGALSDEVKDGVEVVLTGSLAADKSFKATEVALRG